MMMLVEGGLRVFAGRADVDHIVTGPRAAHKTPNADKPLFTLCGHPG